jgi:hypothetical protein
MVRKKSMGNINIEGFQALLDWANKMKKQKYHTQISCKNPIEVSWKEEKSIPLTNIYVTSHK